MTSISRRPAVFGIAAALVVAAALVLAFSMRAHAQGNGNDHAQAHMQHTNPLLRTEASVEFRDQMRKLWEDHITWTRLAIISLAADAPDTQPTVQRLLDNQVDIGNAIKPYYGDAAGDQLTSLLHDHIVIAAELVTDAKAGDTTAFADAQTRWYDNANQIAQFLHDANPQNISLADMQAMMKTHLDLTLEEASDRLQGNFPGDIAAYDKVHAEILEMSDTIALGIIEQFPNSFR
jgi:hypothetical protein